MDCLVTLNVGNYMCETAHNSLIAAADRWQVDYVEVTTPVKEGINVCYSKPALLHRLGHYERVAYFDADILIRDDAPNPFLDQEIDMFYAVRDISESRYTADSTIAEAIRNEAHIPWYHRVEERFGLGLQLESFCENFFNAGVLFFSPQASEDILAPIVEEIGKLTPELAATGRYEQAMMNYFAQASGRLRLIDERWNYLSPPVENGSMHTWVYHFTGYKGHLIKNRINGFPWRCS